MRKKQLHIENDVTKKKMDHLKVMFPDKSEQQILSLAIDAFYENNLTSFFLKIGMGDWTPSKKR